MPQPLPRDLSGIPINELRRLLSEYWNDREQYSRIIIEIEKRAASGESGDAIANELSSHRPQQSAEPVAAPQAVVVKDIDMPFGSMVAFMVKWTIASIPAFIILFILAVIVSAMFLPFFVGLAGIRP